MEMSRRNVTGLLALLAFVVLQISCATAPHEQGLQKIREGSYREAVELLEPAEQVHPADYRVKREIGIAYYKTRRFDEAIEKLSAAEELHPGDGKSIFYLGLAYEKKEMLNQAIGAYKKYANLSRSKYLKRNIAIRLKQLDNERITRAVTMAIAQEQTIQADSIPKNTIAVLYFQNLSGSVNLDPLQKGLTQMLITDLAKVDELQVVERLRLQKLLEELELGSSGLVEKGSEPRIGKLVGARKIVQGDFTDLSDDNLRIDASLSQTTTSEVTTVDEVTGKLNALFQLEKSLAFGIIEELGIDLTTEEREAIQKIPTESMLAYLAYSRGLDFEDRGMFAEAKGQYQQAVDLDPAFQEARQSLEDIELTKAAAETAMSDTDEFEDEFSIANAIEALKNSRIVNSSFAAQTGQTAYGDNDNKETLQEGTGTDNATLTNALLEVVIPLPSN